MKFSKRGAKDNRTKLVWSKYFNYKLENKDYYFKQKAYATHCDGWTEHEAITKQTYTNAIKRGNQCTEIIVEKDIMAASLNALALIFSKKYGVCEDEARESILKARAAIQKIREGSIISANTEYRIFKKVLKLHMNINQEDLAI